MARTATNTAQAAIARRIAISRRTAGQPRHARRVNTTMPKNAMLEACIAAAGFVEHRAY